MSHLDTAYQMGTKQAEADFQAELAKVAGPGEAIPPASTATLADKLQGNAKSVVNPGASAGLAPFKPSVVNLPKK